MKVRELMNDQPLYVFSGDTIQKASEEMAEHHRGLVVVFDSIDTKNVIGVLSNKDIVEKVISVKKSPSSVFVRGVMRENPIACSPDDNTSKAMELMRKHNIKRIVVIQNDSLVGIISSNDILDAMIRYKKELLDLAIDF
jgi:CBS domain-containing protein